MPAVRDPRRRPFGRAALTAAALALHASAALAATTPNLVANGDAETGRCTPDWTAQTSVPGWRVVRGAASVLCYAAFDVAHATVATPQAPSRGNALFAAPGADTSMEQSVDVGAAAEAIDAGAVSFELSAWIGGWADRPERATLVAVFLDAAGHATGAPVAIADADAAARGHATALVARKVEGKVAPRTRRIVVTVQFASGMASFHDAYADDIELHLGGPAAAIERLVPRAATPPVAHVPALDHVFVVMMENTNYADVVHTHGGVAAVDVRMPYFASLARRGVLLANLWQTYHPSDQNYVAMVAGDTFRAGPVYFPDYHLPAAHVGDLLQARGKRWRAYVQEMRTPCNLDSAGEGRRSFSPDDEPFVQFADIAGDKARCTANVRDLDDLAAAIAADTLPDFAWIAADNWWDGEGAWFEDYDIGFSNAAQDRFLRETLAPLVDSDAWRKSRSLLVVTWDETDGWGWPDNHVPTVLVGSPGLLREGATLLEHANGYDLLRTFEAGLRIDGLGRFDEFAHALDGAFAGSAGEDDAASLPWPAERVATRGGIDDTFGRAATPAAVVAGEPLALVVPAGVDERDGVVLEPLGRLPDAASKTWRFDADRVGATIPTAGLAPGLYAAWLRRGDAPPAVAPMPVRVLPRPSVGPDAPGVEIVGASGDAAPALREGANPIVRYCLAPDMVTTDGWIGIFPDGTPADRMTKAEAKHVGFWLKTPQRCGEAEAYVAGLKPELKYRVRLFRQRGDGASEAVGTSAGFGVIAALPR